MSQIEATKANQYVLIGPAGDEASATKVMLYLILEPGTIEGGGDDASGRQGHVHAQILRRS